MMMKGKLSYVINPSKSRSVRPSTTEKDSSRKTELVIHRSTFLEQLFDILHGSLSLTI